MCISDDSECGAMRGAGVSSVARFVVHAVPGREKRYCVPASVPFVLMRDYSRVFIYYFIYRLLNRASDGDELMVLFIN